MLDWLMLDLSLSKLAHHVGLIIVEVDSCWTSHCPTWLFLDVFFSKSTYFRLNIVQGGSLWTYHCRSWLILNLYYRSWLISDLTLSKYTDFDFMIVEVCSCWTFASKLTHVAIIVDLDSSFWKLTHFRFRIVEVDSIRSYHSRSDHLADHLARFLNLSLFSHHPASGRAAGLGIVHSGFVKIEHSVKTECMILVGYLVGRWFGHSIGRSSVDQSERTSAPFAERTLILTPIDK